jgi:uncharacterized cupredoxin-like copper-binding protein
MRKLLVLAAFATLAVPVSGCGDDDPDGTDSAPATPAATTGATTATTTVRMSEYAFDPQEAVAAAGRVTISAPNDGKLVHELVLLKTDADPAALPMKGGEVDESTAVGEIADVKAGATKKTTLKLAAGTYVMVCALPGHYQQGMFGTLIVK